VTIEVESGIDFDFRTAVDLKRHDRPVAQGGEGNTIWNGVDFRVLDSVGWVWVEVKSWNPGRIAPRYRGGNQRRFVGRMRSREFGLELRAKFLGTTSFLAWTGAFLPAPVTYVVVLQPPRPLDKALMGTFATRVRAAFPNPGPWTQALSVAVVDLADWNALYPHFPAKIL
jgi:hypothetical protein